MEIIQQNNEKYKILWKKTQSIYHYNFNIFNYLIGAVN